MIDPYLKAIVGQRVVIRCRDQVTLEGAISGLGAEVIMIRTRENFTNYVNWSNVLYLFTDNVQPPLPRTETPKADVAQVPPAGMTLRLDDMGDNLFCVVCGELQFVVPTGHICSNGHHNLTGLTASKLKELKRRIAATEEAFRATVQYKKIHLRAENDLTEGATACGIMIKSLPKDEPCTSDPDEADCVNCALSIGLTVKEVLLMQPGESIEHASLREVPK